MELVKEQRLAATSPHLVEWPKVPKPSIQNKATPEKTPFTEEQLPSVSKEEKLDLGNLKQKPVAIQSFTEALQAQRLRERLFKPLRKVASTKPSWPEPHLSLGTECHSVDGNECWKACGPAQELFAQISESIRNLLDVRVGELEEGEPEAGDILAFDMYMVGKSRDTAQPTLIFTCRSSNRRRRAIKFLKESTILHGHPKIRLAARATSPLAARRQYTTLLSAPVGAIVGGVIGGVRVLLVPIVLFSFIVRRNKKREYFRDEAPPHMESSARNQQVALSLPQPVNFELSQLPPFQLLVKPEPSTLGTISDQPEQAQPQELADPFSWVTTPLQVPFYEPNQNAAIGSNSQSSQNVEAPFQSTLLATYGMAIICPSSGKRATIGGILRIKSIYYCLTVAHAFENQFYSETINTTPTHTESEEEDLEFWFESDEEDLSEADTVDLAFPSQITASSTGSIPMEMLQRTSENEPQSPQIVPSIHQNAQTGDESVTFVHSMIVPEPIASSTSGMELGLDWALIPLSHIKLEDNPGKKIGKDFVLPHRFAEGIHGERDVVIVSGYSGILNGKILSSLTMMKLAKYSKFQELWAVKLDMKLVEGDSGSWVLDTITGDLYGHIVAGISGGHIAYIVPAYKILEDLSKILGGQANLDVTVSGDAS